MMWLIFYFLNILLIIKATTTTNTNGPRLIKFDEKTLNKLRLSPSSLSALVSYVDYELLNEYQCAIECIKEKSTCTGYTYDTANKICSLFNDQTRIVDEDITKIVCLIKNKKNKEFLFF